MGQRVALCDECHEINTVMKEWTKLIEETVRRCRDAELKARRERKSWENLQKQLVNADQRPFSILSLLDRLRKLNSPHVQELAELEAMWQEKADEQINHYRDLLAQALEPEHHTVEGRLPEYRINKVIEVHLDEKRRRAQIGTRFHNISLQDDISVTTVADAVKKEVERLFKRPLKEDDFLKTLWRAYLLVLTDEGRPQRIGEPVPILTVHRFVVLLRQKDAAFADATGKKFVPYLPDEFAVDIGRLLEKGVTRTEQGHSLHLTPGRKPREALFIVNFATGVGQNYSLLGFQSPR